jgi:hypothetical protein
MGMTSGPYASGKALRIIALVAGLSYLAMATIYWSRSNAEVRASSTVYCLAFLVYALIPRHYLSTKSIRAGVGTIMVLAVAAAVWEAGNTIRALAYMSVGQVVAQMVFFLLLLLVVVSAFRMRGKNETV